MALGIGQALGHAIAQRGDEGVGSAQVNAHRDTSLVGIRRLARFGNL